VPPNLKLDDLGSGIKLAGRKGRKEYVWLVKLSFSKVQNHLIDRQIRSAPTAISPEIAMSSNGLHDLSVDDVESRTICRLNPDLSCIGLVITLGEVVEDGLGVVGDARGRGDLLGAEADGGGP
jgi:hypothetical protein